MESVELVIHEDCDTMYDEETVLEDRESGICSGYGLLSQTLSISEDQDSRQDYGSEHEEDTSGFLETELETELFVREEQDVASFYMNFNHFIRDQFGDWSLEEVSLDSPLLQPYQSTRWKRLMVEGKAKFRCAFCRHVWTSMFTSMTFFYRPFPSLDGGVVRFYLYGQKCLRCQDYYVIPEWYDDEAERAIFLLFTVLGEAYYGLTIDSSDGNIKKAGNPKGPHRRALCEACKTGTCPYDTKM